MTKIVDLTFQEVVTASGLPNLIITDNTQGLLLRISALTGVISTDINSQGFLQLMYKLREFGVVAQNTVNVGQSIGERLAAFPPQSSGSAINGYVTISQQIITKAPVNTNLINGVNN